MIIVRPVARAAVLATIALLASCSGPERIQVQFEPPVIDTQFIDVNVTFAQVRVTVTNPNKFPVWVRATQRRATIDGYRNNVGSSLFEEEILAGGKTSIKSENIVLDHVAPGVSSGAMDFRICLGRSPERMDQGRTMRTQFQVVHAEFRHLTPTIEPMRVIAMRCR